MTSTLEVLAFGTGLVGLIVAVWAKLEARKANTLSIEANNISEQARLDAKAANDRANELAEAQLVLNAGVALAQAGESAIEKLQAKGQNKMANQLVQILAKMTRRLGSEGLAGVEGARQEIVNLLGSKRAKQLGLV